VLTKLISLLIENTINIITIMDIIEISSSLIYVQIDNLCFSLILWKEGKSKPDEL